VFVGGKLSCAIGMRRCALPLRSLVASILRRQSAA